MTLLNNKRYFSVGGKTNEEIEITDISFTDRPNVILGRAILPLSKLEKNVVIYGQTLADGNVYCSLHHRPIGVFSEYNYAYLVEKRADKFFIVKT